jgi:hypothetical protein
METKELIANLRVEYYGILEAARQQGIEQHIIDFYDFLLTRNFSRQQLSAHGISRENALTWRGN